MSYISYTYASGSPGRKAMVNEETQNLVTYLNNNASGSYSHWNFGDCGVHAGGYGDGDAGEKQFIKDVLENLDQNASLVEGENVCIAHSKWAWGYGRSMQYTTSQGTTAHGCTVFAGDLTIGDYEVRGFTWHEAMHSYGAGHGDGRYYLTSDNQMFAITPMAMSYLYDKNAAPDTTYAGGGYEPSSFCAGNPNYSYTFRYSASEKNHDINQLSVCTENKA